MRTPREMRKLFYAQMNAVNTGHDLRKFLGDPEMKELIQDTRALCERTWRYFWDHQHGVLQEVRKGQTRMYWDEHLIRVHFCLEEKYLSYPEEVDPDEPVQRLMVRYIDYHRAIRGY